MLSANEVLTYMQDWWGGAPDDGHPRTTSNVLFVGVNYLRATTAGEYMRLRPQSRVHFMRQLFTVWKAVCAKLPQYSLRAGKLDMDQDH